MYQRIEANSPTHVSDQMVERMGYDKALTHAEACAAGNSGDSGVFWRDVAALIRLMRTDDEA